jgi:RNA polymerase sigma factor (sigma-70 family)
MTTWGLMARGDKEAFLAVYQSQYEALFAYGFSLSMDRELTKDCIQELFLEVWNSRPSLNKEVKDVRSYLFTWLRRKITRELSRLAKDKYSGELNQDILSVQSSYEELLIAFQLSEDKKEQLSNALKKLTKKQLEMVKLKFFDNLSYQAISDQTELTHRTVYNLIYEAIRHLRDSMKPIAVKILI